MLHFNVELQQTRQFKKPEPVKKPKPLTNEQIESPHRDNKLRRILASMLYEDKYGKPVSSTIDYPDREFIDKIDMVGPDLKTKKKISEKRLLELIYQDMISDL